VALNATTRSEWEDIVFKLRASEAKWWDRLKALLSKIYNRLRQWINLTTFEFHEFTSEYFNFDLPESYLQRSGRLCDWCDHLKGDQLAAVQALRYYVCDLPLVYTGAELTALYS